MTRRPTIYVTVDGYDSLVSGPGSRDMVEGVTGRPPTWSRYRRGWVVQEHTARRVIALAESYRCDIVISGSRAQVSRDWTPDTPVSPAVPEPESLLW